MYCKIEMKITAKSFCKNKNLQLPWFTIYGQMLVTLTSKPSEFLQNADLLWLKNEIKSFLSYHRVSLTICVSVSVLLEFLL